MFVGTGAKPTRVNHNRMIVLELEALGTFNYSAEGFRPALDLLDSGDAAGRPAHRGRRRAPLGVMEAMDQLARGEIAPKCWSDRRPHDGTGRRPVLNHVAISVDAAVLDDAGRADLLDFFGEVFGWVEGDNSTETGNPLILYTGELRQFLYLLPGSRGVPSAPRRSTTSGWRCRHSMSWLRSWSRAKAYRTGTTG